MSTLYRAEKGAGAVPFTEISKEEQKAYRLKFRKVSFGCSGMEYCYCIWKPYPYFKGPFMALKGGFYIILVGRITQVLFV